MASEGLPVQAACRLLDVSESGYYHWRNRPPSQRSIRHAWLLDQIRAVHAASRGTYGCGRVHVELTLGLGITVGYNQIEMLTARAGIKGLPGNRRRLRQSACESADATRLPRLRSPARAYADLPSYGTEGERLTSKIETAHNPAFRRIRGFWRVVRV